MEKKGICLIEWPIRLGHELTPKDRLDIHFQIKQKENDDDEEDLEVRTRYVTLTPHGKKWSQQIRKLDEEGYLDDLIIE